MSAIEVTGEYKVAATRTVTVHGTAAFILNASVYGDSPYLINAGTVNVIGPGSGGVVGVDSGDYGSGRGVFNQAGGVFSITSDAEGEGVTGFHLTDGAFTNDGEVHVASAGSGASGVSDDGALQFSNTGTFEVSGQAASGV